MFEQNSFLIRPPYLLNFEQRICLEALAIALRGAMHACNDLSRLVDSYVLGLDENQIESFRGRAHLLVSSCISQVHAARQLITALGTKLPSDSPLSQFLEKYEPATRIRNVIDHLHEGLSNQAKKKTEQPLFGQLSFFRRTGTKIADDGVELLLGIAITVPFGSLARTNEIHHFINPAGRNIASPLFECRVRDWTIQLSELPHDILAVVRRIEERLRTSLSAQAEAIAKENGMDVAKLLNQPPSAVMTLHLELFD